ncbi:MAG: DUF4982 domain-containing protein [Chitinophaga sp.]|uniref:glycoside hydrolase family 2 TIM barrel-domain containing protein n=1 Tax=Chitinophaga sp. TaxID=1869181 RepID=UPI0025BE5E2D|nr:glycoside hydrolase family 2 TIM barrel-domain containing protein [Chitinophaga sp.]MBV8251438.1 DUF4982 domain-containing protein [Chitinophaga sp.]
MFERTTAVAGWLSILIILLTSSPGNAQVRSFNTGWKFTAVEFASSEKVDSFRRLGINWSDQFLIEQTNETEGIQAMDTAIDKQWSALKDRQWYPVSLPHTAFPEPLVIVKPREGVAYYQKKFEVAPAWKGKRLTIVFEGAMQVMQVWINGKYMGRFTGGYLPFEVDFTDVARYGAENMVLVKLNNKANPVVPPGKPVGKMDFIYYSGIYRDVWLHIRNPLHISSSITANKIAGGGIFVTYPTVAKEQATVEVQTHLENNSDQPQTFFIEQAIIDKSGKSVAIEKSTPYSLSAGAENHYLQQLTVLRPSLWHPDHPYLYHLRTRIFRGKEMVDEQITQIGIRSFDISAQKGLLINGEPFRIAGTNRHQNYPYIGNAISDQASYRDAWLIKAAGMNAVRAAHYPPDPSFMDAADELGILIINCIPGWQYFNKNPAFEDNVMRDIRQMVRRDRNHPSVVLWEVSLNETYPSAAFRCRQAEVARSEWRGGKNFFTSGDSYFTKACYDVPYDDWNGDPGARNNTTYPDHAFLIREYGDYEFGGGNSTSRQLRSTGEAGLLAQAWNLQWSHNKNRKIYPRALGDLNWAFYDGLAGVVVGIEGWGVADIFRIPKYSYYMYKSQQPLALNPMLPFASGPMVFIASNWNSQSDPSKVVVYSNCEEVSLYLNDKLIATQKPDHGPETEHNDYSPQGHGFDGGNASNLLHPPFTFSINGFVPGTLKAIGLAGGKPVTDYSISTPGKPAKIQLEAGINGKPFQAGGDMIFVYAHITDEKGQLLWDTHQPVNISITGDARLLSPATVDAEAGIATFIVQSGESKNAIIVQATAGGLKSQPFLLKASGK